MNQAQALKILKSGANVFLTGEPGSGKTYTINEFVKYLRSHSIMPAITASTGIAATHIGGMTIHSWSGIGIRSRLSGADLRVISTNDYVRKRIKKANILIIDEISMLPPQTLQMIDAICREVKKNSQAFGGMQVVLVGDFFQLPPVVKQSYNRDPQEEIFEEKPIKFAYDAPVWQQAEFVTCCITEQYRQDDSKLLSLLSKIRANKFDASSLAHIKQRKIDSDSHPANVPKLYSHNLDVDEVNAQMLAQVQAEEVLFQMRSKGHDKLIEVMKKGCLSPENLYLKVGASVMFTKNSPKDGFVNGTLGIVQGFNAKNKLPIVELRNGRKVEVEYADWSVEEDGKIKGILTQIPLRLAWAITVHKSQGISLDEAVIDLSKVFEFGQGYVALSRVRRLEGIHIIGWNDVAFKVDPEVLKKDAEFRHQSIEASKVYESFTDKESGKMEYDFIKFCGGEIEISDIDTKKNQKKTPTVDVTLELLSKRNNITQIAKKRSLSEETILGHIEDLVSTGKLERSKLRKIIPDKVLKELPAILKVFKSLDTLKLSPVFEYFKGKYSYDDLRLARMMIGDSTRIREKSLLPEAGR